MGCLSAALGCLGGTLAGLVVGGLAAGILISAFQHVPERAASERIEDHYAALIDRVRQHLRDPEQLRRLREPALVAVRQLKELHPTPKDIDLLSGQPRPWGAHIALLGGYGIIEDPERWRACLIYDLRHEGQLYWLYLADPQAPKALEPP
ncbi:MAG: hypothetical protein NZ552_00675 [Planctomycetes bacterium]|nr:hypothetical protein [Planctomycetota bacterium]